MSPSPADMPNKKNELWTGAGHISINHLSDLPRARLIAFSWLAWAAALRKDISEKDLDNLGRSNLDELKCRGLVLILWQPHSKSYRAIMPGYTPQGHPKEPDKKDGHAARQRREFLESLKGRPSISGVKIPPLLPEPLLSQLEELAKQFKSMPQLPLSQQVSLTEKQLNLFRAWNKAFPKNRRVASEISRIETTLATKRWELRNQLGKNS